MTFIVNPSKNPNYLRIYLIPKALTNLETFKILEFHLSQKKKENGLERKNNNKYLKHSNMEQQPTTPKSIILDDRAQALAAYPHAKVVGNLIFVSGISSRRLDNTYEGVLENPGKYLPLVLWLYLGYRCLSSHVLLDGSFTLNIKEQTHAVIKK